MFNYFFEKDSVANIYFLTSTTEEFIKNFRFNIWVRICVEEMGGGALVLFNRKSQSNQRENKIIIRNKLNSKDKTAAFPTCTKPFRCKNICQVATHFIYI